MIRLKIILALSVLSTLIQAQVKIRLYTSQSPESVTFTVVSGNYKINDFSGSVFSSSPGENIVIAKFNNRLVVKKVNIPGFVCDSISIFGQTGTDSFSLRVNGSYPVKQYYSGDLKCLADIGTLLLINTCDIEKYIAGVVMAEGGRGRNIEYFKTQAVIARTYMYKYMDKHMQDGFNVCDNTHCQAFNGLSADSVLNLAAIETKGEVILDKDSLLIIAAFHSNCGGETASSEDVWLTAQPYLKSVIDPYCSNSRNAVWTKSYSYSDWLAYLKKSGYNGRTDDPSVFNFNQKFRVTDYSVGTYSLPLRNMRNDLDLRSTYFSIIVEGDSVLLNGRGYGHGVGLCQEGAMAMALKGFDYRSIISFYYKGVIISDIKNAVNLTQILPPLPAGRQATPHMGG